MEISIPGFGALTAALMESARPTAQGRVLFSLEGGYNLFALKDGVKSVLLTLSGEQRTPPPELRPSPALERELEPVFKAMKGYWPVGR